MAKKKKTARKTAAPKRTAARRTAPKRTAEGKTWIVTTSADRPMADIAKDLSKAGFLVDQTLEQIGVITGRCDDSGAAKARRIRGVTDVSPEHKVDIGPPGSRDTW